MPAKRVNHWYFAGAVAAALLLATLLGVPAIKKAIASPKHPSTCGPTYYANAAPKGSNYFGPSIQGSTTPVQLADIQKRRGCDSALVVAHAISWGLPGFTGLTTDAATVAKINQLNENRSLWAATNRQLEKRESVYTATTTTTSGPYVTMMMIPQGSKPPLIRQIAMNRSAPVIVFRNAAGQVVNMYELDCGAQPRRNTSFGLPPVTAPHPPAVQTHVTPPTTPGTTPHGPPTTIHHVTTTVPHTTTTIHHVTTTVPHTTTTLCPPGTHPSPLNGVCIAPKDPSQDPINNGSVPPIVKGPGTTPVGSDPGPATQPTDSPTGCNGPCPQPPQSPTTATTATTTPPPTDPPDTTPVATDPPAPPGSVAPPPP